MADNGFKVKKSLNLSPQTAEPSNPTDGDVYYNSTANTFAYYHQGAWANMDSIVSIAAVASMTSTTFVPSAVQNPVIRLTGSIAGTIHGITSSFNGKRLFIFNNTTADQLLKNESTTETTGTNRINTPTNADMTLSAGEAAQLIYEPTVGRWLVVSITQNGIQAAATTSTNGLVTLHKDSATPANPIVLTDGDLNVASGVLGLDANKAATITATGTTTGLVATGSAGNGIQGISSPGASIKTGVIGTGHAGTASIGGGQGGAFTGGNATSGNFNGGVGVFATGGDGFGTGTGFPGIQATGGNKAVGGEFTPGATATDAILAHGVVKSTTGGFKFPDATTQTTSATNITTTVLSTAPVNGTWGSLHELHQNGAGMVEVSAVYIATSATVGGSTTIFNVTPPLKDVYFICWHYVDSSLSHVVNFASINTSGQVVFTNDIAVNDVLSIHVVYVAA